MTRTNAGLGANPQGRPWWKRGEVWTIVASTGTAVGIVIALMPTLWPPPPSPTPPRSPDVVTRAPLPQAAEFHSGNITVMAGFTKIDLDSADADWAPAADAVPEVALVQDALGLPALDLSLFTPQALRPDYYTCKDLTGYSPATVQLASIRSNDYGCVKTSRGRIAAIQFLRQSISLDPASVSIRVRVYDDAESI